MYVHIWRMRARKKKAEDYEKFGRQVTVPALKKIDGCVDAHFIKVFEARKPEYLWLVFWRDNEALEAARSKRILECADHGHGAVPNSRRRLRKRMIAHQLPPRGSATTQ